ncbi:MAG: hypothetical protein ACI4NA_02830, partial [Succinivibrio sp.]
MEASQHTDAAAKPQDPSPAAREQKPAAKNTHRPGDLPGQKASPVEQHKKPILEITDLTKKFGDFS